MVQDGIQNGLIQIGIGPADAAGGDAGALQQLPPGPGARLRKAPLGPGDILHSVAQVSLLVKEPLVVEGGQGLDHRRPLRRRIGADGIEEREAIGAEAIEERSGVHLRGGEQPVVHGDLGYGRRKEGRGHLTAHITGDLGVQKGGLPVPVVQEHHEGIFHVKAAHPAVLLDIHAAGGLHQLRGGGVELVAEGVDFQA